MTILHLGVIDLHYADAASYKGTGARRAKAATGSMTTGDVAEILEKKYHVMEFFWKRHGNVIADMMTQSLVAALEAAHAGVIIKDPLGQASSQIQRRFKEFLTQKEMDNLVPGVPTQAAIKGVSRRFKRSHAKRPSRPSFIDTGLYRGSFKAWFDK